MLDDGWFRHRRDDTAGLGDWYVDDDRVAGRARAADRPRHRARHASSASGSSRRWSTRTPTCTARTRTGCSAPGHGTLPPRGASPAGAGPQRCRRRTRTCSTGSTSCCADNDIAFLKWDHNRDLVAAGHDGRPGVHGQTLAVYRLLDELRARHPGRGDRELLVRRRAGGPGDPRPHGPGVGERLQRRAGAADDPAVDRAAAAAGADRRARRPAARRTSTGRTQRPVVPLRHGAVRPLRHRVGHRVGHAGGAARPGRGDRLLQGQARRCCTRASWSAPTTPTRPRTCTAWSPGTARPACSPTSS